ncbi:unnamed protein product [Adineta ricciae]|uniref:Uncharacterized protein n=1 Tax=Adineta ricciae TaxID=249248 RepID=A0A815R655_ADIRI|nr:unnamed protein product [Adineta ricciae]
MSCCSDWQGNVWKRKNVVDLRWKSSTFWLLALSSPLTLYDLNAIPDKCLWGGHLQFLPLAYSVAGLAGPGLIAILYRKSYGPLVISGIGSAMGFILGCFGFHGLYDWVEKSMDLMSVFYIGIRYQLRCTSLFQARDFRYKLLVCRFICVIIAIVLGLSMYLFGK